MPCATLAQLITETLAGIGFPAKELCETEDAARAVTHSLALAKQVTTFSSQNLDFRKYEWTPASRDESLLGAPDISVPAWAERQISVGTDDYWKFVPTCNLATLEEARTRGEFRCAFYVENGQLRIRFSYNPQDLAYPGHRLYYDPNPWLAETFNDTALDSQSTALPANFFPMISGMAELELIPTMRIRAAMNTENPASEQLIAAWVAREQYLVGKVALWRDRFQHFAYGSRGERRGVRRRNVLRRGGASW